MPVMLVKSLDILALPRVHEHLLSDRNSHNYKHQGSESLFQLLFHLRLVSYQFSTKDQISASYWIVSFKNVCNNFPVLQLLFYILYR